ncbi:MAG: BatA domain-containing protein, partial [Planctomycetaceae bacterium]
MSLLHPAILYGLGLAAIPVILHLLLRQKPRKLLFPALRLIQNRRKQNVRRMRIRHLLLLLLRVAVIAAIVIAIARPSVPAADYSLSFSETLTLLGVIAAAVAVYYGMSFR